jgi:hypothetical protein
VFTSDGISVRVFISGNFTINNIRNSPRNFLKKYQIINNTGMFFRAIEIASDAELRSNQFPPK